MFHLSDTGELSLVSDTALSQILDTQSKTELKVHNDDLTFKGVQNIFTSPPPHLQIPMKVDPRRDAIPVLPCG